MLFILKIKFLTLTRSASELTQSLLTALVPSLLPCPLCPALRLTQGPYTWSCPWLPNLLQVFAQRLGSLQELVCFFLLQTSYYLHPPPLFPILPFLLTVMPSKTSLLKNTFFTLRQKLYRGEERFLCVLCNSVALDMMDELDIYQ